MYNRYILFQAYGNEGTLAECKCALLHLLMHNPGDAFCIVIYTDNESYFKAILALFKYYIIETLPQEKVKEWRGQIDFVHRVKIKMFQHFFSKNTGSVLYCDTDTCCLQPTNNLFEQIEKKALIMHTYEWNIGNGENLVSKKWKRFLESKPTILKIPDISAVEMWNAGIIGIHSSQSELLDKVLALTDELYPFFQKHTVEQFSFSYIFQQQKKIKSADSYFFHYWDLKEYKELLLHLFKSNALTDIATLSKKMQQVPASSIMKDKAAFKKKPFYKKWFLKKWSIGQYLIQ
jgi:hypothetical protein